jgi:hypothetical protein
MVNLDINKKKCSVAIRIYACFGTLLVVGMHRSDATGQLAPRVFQESLLTEPLDVVWHEEVG